MQVDRIIFPSVHEQCTK